MKIKTAALFAAIIGWSGFIFSNSLKSRAESSHQSSGLEELLEKLVRWLGFDGSGLNFALIVRKGAHIFEFFLLCLLLYCFFDALIKNKKTVNLLSATVTFAEAAADECLQIISGRDASVKDVFVDCIGIVFAYLTVKIILKIRTAKEL